MKVCLCPNYTMLGWGVCWWQRKCSDPKSDTGGPGTRGLGTAETFPPLWRLLKRVRKQAQNQVPSPDLKAGGAHGGMAHVTWLETHPERRWLTSGVHLQPGVRELPILCGGCPRVLHFPLVPRSTVCTCRSDSAPLFLTCIIILASTPCGVRPLYLPTKFCRFPRAGARKSVRHGRRQRWRNNCRIKMQGTQLSSKFRGTASTS